MKFLITILLLFLTQCFPIIPLTSQNLISNPGFEKCDNCGRFGNSGVEFSFLNGANNPVDWFGVTDGSSDIRSTLAHTGKRHGGFYSFGKFEYLGNVLAKTLEAGAEYQFSFWLGAEETSQYSLDEIGVFFHQGLPKYSGTSNLGKRLTPDIVTPDGEFLPSNSYKQFTFTYLACGGEDHIIIGRFKDLGKNDTLFIGTGKPTSVYPYTYVDDVELIKINDAPNLLPDSLLLCNNDTRRIGIPGGYTNVHWSNGSSGDSTTVYGSDGKIIVEFNFGKTCIIRDTMIISALESTNIDVLPEKIILCKNEFAKIGIPNIYKDIVWSNGSTADSTIIKPSDEIIFVTFRSINSCDPVRDTVIIVRKELEEKVEDLIANKSICLMENTTIEVDPKEYYSFEWNTGTYGKNLVVKDTGVYIVKASNDCYYALDTLFVRKGLPLNELLQIPNVITPSLMENNKFRPFLKPILMDSLVSYELEIYNRWGKIIFSTSQTDEPWIPQQNQPAETYFYKILCTFRDCGDLQAQNASGAVNIIR